MEVFENLKIKYVMKVNENIHNLKKNGQKEITFLI